MSDGVPVIDLSPLFGGEDPGEVDAVAAAVAGACRRWGFFQVVGHRIPAALMARVGAESRRFFALPAAEKRALSRSKETIPTRPASTRQQNRIPDCAQGLIPKVLMGALATVLSSCPNIRPAR